MSLVDQAKKDIEDITSNTSEWAKTADFTAPNGVIQENVTVIHAKHHTGFTENGERVNTKYASVAVSEDNLNFYNYPIRDANDDVDMAGHRVDIADSTGVVKNYIVREWYPDEMVGLIVLILGEYTA